VARSGLKSGAQGLPGFTLGGSPQANGPEGATRYGDNRLGTFEPDRVRVSGPFRAKLYFRLTQGKPRVNPGLSYFGHFGPRIGNVQTPPRTSCQATIAPSLRDESPAHRSASHYPSANGGEPGGESCSRFGNSLILAPCCLSTNIRFRDRA
jgi:hypothetical protein